MRKPIRRGKNDEPEDEGDDEERPDGEAGEEAAEDDARPRKTRRRSTLSGRAATPREGSSGRNVVIVVFCAIALLCSASAMRSYLVRDEPVVDRRPRPTDDSGSAPREAVWTEFTPPEGWFTAAFPSSPVASEMSMGTLRLKTWRGHDPGDGLQRVYAVMCLPIPDNVRATRTTDQILDGLVEGEVSQVAGSRLAYSKPVTLGATPGREAQLVRPVPPGTSMSPIRNSMRFFLAKPRVYGLSVVFSEDQESAREVERFFASLRIKDE